MLPLLKFSTFNVSIRRPAFCENRSIERMFATHVTCPRSIKLNVPLEIQGETRFYTRQYKINSHQVKNELCRLVNEGKPLYQGKTLYGGLLVIAEYRSNFIELAANPDYKPYPENRCESSAKNVLRKISSLTNGAPDESIKDLVEGDLKACIRILAQDHPEEVKDAINNRNFDPILARQDGKSLANILHVVISGLLKLEQIHSSSDIKDLYHFLPQDALKEITGILSANNIFITGQYCRRVHKAISRLKSSDREKVQRIVKQANEKILHTIYEAGKQIKATIGMSLNNFYEKPDQEIELEKLREAIHLLWEANIPAILPPGYISEIAQSISESAREKLLAEIDKSNLVENAKQPLLHMLAEKEYIYVSMYSFTSPLYTAALMAAMLRGTQVRILMDKQQAAQASSQYDEMLNLAHEMRHIYPNLPPFEPRLSQDVQHQKNIIFGSGTYVLGSQNMTWNGMARNLEDFIIVKNDPVSHQAKEREFLDLYGFSGSFIPFPKEIAAQPWLQRSGLTGIRFKERTPFPGEVDEIMRQFRMSIADFSKIRNIMEIAKGKNFEIEYDFTRPFHPFMVGMDPVIARFLTRFLEDVPLGFAFAPASESGKFHPGTTTGLSGLIEHELIGCELVTVLCKVLGREDLRDKALAAFIAHDTYKDAHKQADGIITWGHYNRAHGPLAEEKFNQAIENAEPAEREILRTVLAGAGIAIGQHMGAYNEPVPTPLLPTDPEIKRIVQLADVLASRKYLLVKHRAMQPRTTEEILNLMLNNSFTIEGEGLSSIGKDPEIFDGIKKIAASIGYKINSYEDLPQHAQEMLRVAESLCDVYGEYKEVVTKKDTAPTEEEKARIENRNEVLGAVLLYAMLRYRQGIDAPKSDVQFSETIAKLAKAYTVPAYPDPDNRLARLSDWCGRQMKYSRLPSGQNSGPMKTPPSRSSAWPIAS